MSSFITVKVGQIPSRNALSEVVLELGATAGDALSAAGLSSSGFQVKVNGDSASLTQRLNNGDRVLLTREIKGNSDYIEVRVGKVPGTLHSITLNGDRTVATAVTTAGLTTRGFQVRVNGNPAETTRILNHGDRVLLTTEIKGNA